MTSLDVLSLAAELTSLNGGYVDKAFGGEPFSIRFNTDGGKRELVIYEGQFAFLSEPLEKEEGGDIGPLAAMVRKKLDNSRVTGVTQCGFDRVINISFSRPEGMSAVMELMGKGNFILLDGGKVLSALRFEKRKGHDITPGAAYVEPPLRFDVLGATEEELRTEALNSRADIVRTLATVIGLGGDLAEEVCTEAGIAFGRMPGDLSGEEWEKVHAAVSRIISGASGKAEPSVYYSGGKAVQFTPVPFTIFSSLESRKFATLSECVLEFIRSRPEEQRDLEGERVSKLVEKQIEAMDRFRLESETAKEFADGIYLDYQGFVDKMGALRKGGDAPPGYVKNRDGTYTLTVKGVEIRINPQDDVNRIASSIYDMSKEQERKLKRAEEAMAEISARRSAPAPAAKKPEIRKSGKKFWFDRYRWFVSSEGCLVIAGRDARSNDNLVSKHMSDRDRYAHADVYGAPSVVVKWIEGAGEATLEEACTFALCFSRAWNAQIGAAPAYWVMPDQVSKSPQSGEYLPSGAFIIRGKRNYFSKLSLELALGIVEYEGQRRLVCAPAASMRGRVADFYLIRPGSLSKERVAAGLAAKLGVARDEIVSVLPPGKSDYTPAEGAKRGEM